jgi:DNA-binding response OmpR family regulator
MGASDFVLKPVDPQRLLTLVSEHVRSGNTRVAMS